MTQEQKQAITALNKVREILTEEEYFLLMGYVIEKEVVEKTFYVPQQPLTDPIIRPYYDNNPFRITSVTSTGDCGEDCLNIKVK